jgi:hypothetical protein
MISTSGSVTARSLGRPSALDESTRLELYLGYRLNQAGISAIEKTYDSDRPRNIDAAHPLTLALGTPAGWGAFVERVVELGREAKEPISAALRVAFRGEDDRHGWPSRGTRPSRRRCGHLVLTTSQPRPAS